MTSNITTGTLKSNRSTTSYDDDSFISAKSSGSIGQNYLGAALSLVSLNGVPNPSRRDDYDSMTNTEFLSLDSESDDNSNDLSTPSSNELLSFDSALQVSKASFAGLNDLSKHDVLTSFPFFTSPVPLACPTDLGNSDVISSSSFFSMHLDSDSDTQNKEPSVSLTHALYHDLNNLSISKNSFIRNYANKSVSMDTYPQVNAPSTAVKHIRQESTSTVLTYDLSTLPSFPCNLSIVSSSSDETHIPFTVNIGDYPKMNTNKKQKTSLNVLVASKSFGMNLNSLKSFESVNGSIRRTASCISFSTAISDELREDSTSMDFDSHMPFTTALSTDGYPNDGSVSSESVGLKEIKSRLKESRKLMSKYLTMYKSLPLPILSCRKIRKIESCTSVSTTSTSVAHYSARVQELKSKLRSLENKNGHRKVRRRPLKKRPLVRYKQPSFLNEDDSTSFSDESSSTFLTDESATATVSCYSSSGLWH